MCVGNMAQFGNVDVGHEMIVYERKRERAIRYNRSGDDIHFENTKKKPEPKTRP